MRIVEFGSRPLVQTVYPRETVFIGTGPDPIESEDEGCFNFKLSRLPRILSLVRDPGIDAIFVNRGPDRSKEGISALVRLLANRRVITRGIPLTRVMGDETLRFSGPAPIIVHDSSDSTFITRRVLWLFRRASIVFKRELPIDRWQVFTHTIHPDLPTGRFRRIAAYRDIIAKMHPISLGFRVGHEKLFPSGPVEKTRDIFFAGTGSFSSFVRERGSEEIRALIASGLDVDAPEGFLPREEFYRRCAQARLVWSPHGFGHDCFRHYEAAALGSVPLINRPPIEQYERFTDGVNCFFYDPEPGGLTQAIQRALARRDELAAMGEAARAHYRAHHSVKARVDHMLTKAGITLPDAVPAGEDAEAV